MQKQKARQLAEKALVSLAKELEEQPEPLLFMIPREEKLLFLSYLKTIVRMLGEGPLPPRDRRPHGMMQIVLDSWPLTILGDEIVMAERAFLEVPDDEP